MTIEKCKAFCRKKGWALAGVEYSVECYCGDKFPTEMISDSECNKPCSGNKKQICGGGWAMNVYHSNDEPIQDHKFCIKMTASLDEDLCKDSNIWVGGPLSITQNGNNIGSMNRGTKEFKLCLDSDDIDIENDVFKFARTTNQSPEAITSAVCITSLSFDGTDLLVGLNGKRPNFRIDVDDNGCTDDLVPNQEITIKNGNVTSSKIECNTSNGKPLLCHDDNFGFTFRRPFSKFSGFAKHLNLLIHDEFPLVGNCPSSHKYAYLDGKYCCRTNKEKIDILADGELCDGSKIEIDSRCCENGDYVKCEYENCSNHKDDTELTQDASKTTDAIQNATDTTEDAINKTGETEDETKDDM